MISFAIQGAAITTIYGYESLVESTEKFGGSATQVSKDFSSKL